MSDDRQCATCDFCVVVQNMQGERLIQHAQCWYDPPRSSIMLVPPAVMGGAPQQTIVTIRNETQPDSFCGHWAIKQHGEAPAPSLLIQ